MAISLDAVITSIPEL